jgi:hypothetical protein
MKVNVFQFTGTGNTGDAVSAPHLYFDLGDVRVASVKAAANLPPADLAVFGGGAVAGRMIREGLHLKARAKIKVAWGIGRSVHGRTDAGAMPEGLDLLGVREWTGPQRGVYVPCASCMSELFDRRYKATQEAVLFVNADPDIHRKYPVKVTGLPVLTNRAEFEEIVAFLASADVVVTNSYHGAYWAQLLKRKAVVVGAYSSKFHTYRFPPAYAQGDDWRAAAAEARVYTAALSDARKANRAFYKKVMELGRAAMVS